MNLFLYWWIVCHFKIFFPRYILFLMFYNEPFLFPSAFSMNIPNIPIQILAVTETGSANAFFSSDLSHQLITEGNAVADKLQAHFMTSSSTSQQKSNYYYFFFFKLQIKNLYICKYSQYILLYQHLYYWIQFINSKIVLGLILLSECISTWWRQTDYIYDLYV